MEFQKYLNWQEELLHPEYNKSFETKENLKPLLGKYDTFAKIKRPTTKQFQKNNSIVSDSNHFQKSKVKFTTRTLTEIKLSNQNEGNRASKIYTQELNTSNKKRKRRQENKTDRSVIKNENLKNCDKSTKKPKKLLENIMNVPYQTVICNKNNRKKLKMDNSITYNLNKQNNAPNFLNTCQQNEKIDTLIPPQTENVNKMKRFRDFWTTDMNKFYNDSWGEENFDIDATLAAMPSDPSKWQIIPEDMNKFLGGAFRGPHCRRCQQYGHTLYYCPLAGPPKCHLCGGIGHYHTRCPNLMCTTCGTSGPYYTNSCKNCSLYKYIRCSICNLIGHPASGCTDLWRRYHSTTDDESKLTQSTVKVKPVEQRWCSGCAQRGHFYHECSNTVFGHFPNLPYPVSYVPLYKSSTVTEPAVPTLQNQENAKTCESKVEYAMPVVQNRETVTPKSTKDFIDKDKIRFENILKNLKRNCKNMDGRFLEHVESLERDLKNNLFDNKRVKLLYKLQNDLRKK